MVKHTQTIRRQFADELSERIWPFCEIGARVNFEAVTSVSQILQPRETIVTKVRAPKRRPEGVNVTQFNKEGK